MSLTSEPFTMFRTFKMHIGLNRPQIAKLILEMDLSPSHQSEKTYYTYLQGQYIKSSFSTIADGGHLGKQPQKVSSRFLTTVSFFLVLIDTQGVLNQKVSFMFQFFPGSGILRASSMRLMCTVQVIHVRLSLIQIQ